jgi:hypothetical protein
VTQYERTQVGYSIIWIACCVAALLAIIAIFAPPHDRNICLTISAIVLATVPLFYKMTIKIDNGTLRASFGIGLIRKGVQLAQIAGCEPIRIRWWYGWGIHLTPYGWLYNVAGWGAVVITLRNGRKFSLGTDDPHGLAAAIRAGIP